MNKFERTEKKYYLTSFQFHQLIEDLKPYIKEDDHPKYTIYNIYLDTKHHELIYRSLEKPPYKEKMRLRSYGIAKEDTEVFLEMKKKWAGIVYKRRITLPYKEAKDYLFDDKMPMHCSQIFQEINYMKHFYDLKPTLVLYYDRLAYTGRDSSLRITFDTNICYRDHHFSLSPTGQDTYLMDQRNYLMEVKVMGGMPLWLSHLLTHHQIYPISYSKYGKIYQKEMLLNV